MAETHWAAGRRHVPATAMFEQDGPDDGRCARAHHAGTGRTNVIFPVQ